MGKKEEKGRDRRRGGEEGRGEKKRVEGTEGRGGEGGGREAQAGKRQRRASSITVARNKNLEGEKSCWTATKSPPLETRAHLLS